MMNNLTDDEVSWNNSKTEMWLYRMMPKVPWTKQVSNDEVLREMEAKNSYI